MGKKIGVLHAMHGSQSSCGSLLVEPTIHASSVPINKGFQLSGGMQSQTAEQQKELGFAFAFLFLGLLLDTGQNSDKSEW